MEKGKSRVRAFCLKMTRCGVLRRENGPPWGNGKLRIENGKCYVLEAARSVTIIFNSPLAIFNFPAGGKGLDTLFGTVYKRGEFI
jgi:hypothetical protein